MVANVGIARSQNVINQKSSGRGEWSIDSCQDLGGDRRDPGQARPGGRPEMVAHADGAGELHPGTVVDLVRDLEEVAGADGDGVASVSGDVEEGGGDVVIVVEPAEEGGGKGITSQAGGFDIVTEF